MIDTINNPNLLGFYIWAYKNLEQVEYITSQIRKNYPNSDLVISSDNGEDFSFISKKYNCKDYIHGKQSHGFPANHPQNSKTRFGWTVEEAKLWLNRMYRACLIIDSKFVMDVEEDVLIQSRFNFEDADILMMGVSGGKIVKNPIQPSALKWIESRGGKVDYPYYSACGGSIVNRLSFIESYERNIDSFVDNYEDIYQKSIKERLTSDGKKSGWGWPDSILCVIMYCKSKNVKIGYSPISQLGYDITDNAPIVHLFKKFYRK